MNLYTLTERIVYVLKRHAIPIILTLVGVLIAASVGRSDWLSENLYLVIGRAVNTGFGISAILLIIKFAFPKFHIQETVKDDPIAVAILVGLVAIAISNLF
jgi:hypothetical protein